MSHRVEITDAALDDLDEIYLYIARDSPTRGARWCASLLKRAETLSVFPARCPRAPEADAFGGDVRQLLVGAYRILYRIEEGVVFILHLRHGARQPLIPDSQQEIEG